VSSTEPPTEIVHNPAEKTQLQQRLFGLGRRGVAAFAFAANVLLVGLRAGSELAMMSECAPDPRMGMWAVFAVLKLAAWFFAGSLLVALLVVAWPKRFGWLMGSTLFVAWAVAICASSWQYQTARRALVDAADASTSPERLRELVHFDGIRAGDELDSRLATNPSTPPEALRELFHRDHLGTRADHANIATVSSGTFEELVQRDDEALRVAFLGSTWIERMAEFGYLETALTARWPDRDIMFRNLGRSGDNVFGDARAGFGPSERDRWSWERPSDESDDYGFLQMMEQVVEQRPDVILIGYGSRVAFEGDEGLKRLSDGINRLLDALEPTGVRIVLLSPPPHQGQSLELADVGAQNERLRRVTDVLWAIAESRRHLFVDVFGPLQSITRQHSDDERLSDNGVHLNEHGYRLLAGLIAGQLAPSQNAWSLQLTADGAVVAASGTQVDQVASTEFGLRMRVQDDQLPGPVNVGGPRVLRLDGLPPRRYALNIDGSRVASGTAEEWAAGVAITTGPDFARVEQLRQTIVEKNRQFFFGFRPQNETYISLFRREDSGHHAGELAQFAALVGMKEQEIARLRIPPPRQYELVREKEYRDQEVPVDAPSPDVDVEMASFTVHEDLQVNLFASEPMIANPINVNWDERGRAWVSTSSTYPHLRPGQTPNDKIVILEDIDHDGRADTSTVFADNLLVPHSVIPSDGGVFVTQSTDLLFLKDLDGDNRADERRVVFSGFGNSDVHQMVHGLRWGPGGDLYFQQSIYINSYVETPRGPRQLQGAGVWRLRPDTLQLDVASRGMVNPWGFAFDRWGQSFATDGAGGGGISYVFPGSVFESAPGAVRTLKSLNPGHPKACGLEIASGRHLPDSWQGNLITTDFRANRVVRYALGESGSGYKSQPLDDVLTAEHRSFRPVDIKMGPDGAIYVVDWYSPIIDHGEVDFHHPLRDRSHGRIWRLTAKDRQSVEPPPLANASTPQLLDALRLPEQWSRVQARRLLRERGSKAVSPHLAQWLGRLDPADPNFERFRLEGLWMYQGLRHMEASLLRDVLKSEDHHARAAAVRVLADWSRQIPDALELLSRAAIDEQAQVRLEAVNALRGMDDLAAAESALQALDLPVDEPLDFSLWHTCRELKSSWLPMLQAGQKVFGGDDRKLAFAIAAVEDASAIEPLVKLVQEGVLEPDEKAPLLLLIARLGGPQELALVLRSAIESAPQDPAQSAAMLQALAATARHTTAPQGAEQVGSLLSVSNPAVRVAAARLSGRWRILASWQKLLEMASNVERSGLERQTAAAALLRINERSAVEELTRLVGEGSTAPVRITAAAAWAARNPKRAQQSALDLLGAMSDDDDPTPILEAFVDHRDGPQVLAAALDQRKLTASVAAAGVRLCDESGRDLSALRDAFIRAGSLNPLVDLPGATGLAELIGEVQRVGDAHLGEAIYRRAELACSKCHAIGGIGGRVGPDLASLGGSAQLAHLFESLFEPSAKIKEGYQTQSVLTDSGKVMSGRVELQTTNAVLLRDAQDNVRNIPQDEVELIVASPVSLMPTGLTNSLRRDELVHLVRFLSQLGKDKQFRVPNRRFVQEWQVLQTSAIVDAADIGMIRAADDGHWKRVYSTVSGHLPAAEIPAFASGSGEVGFVRFIVSASHGGPLELVFDRDVAGLALWLDGQPLQLSPRTRIELRAGQHALLARIKLSKPVPALSIEILEPEQLIPDFNVGGGAPLGGSRDDAVDDVAVDVGQAEVSALEAVGELRVIESK